MRNIELGEKLRNRRMNMKNLKIKGLSDVEN